MKLGVRTSNVSVLLSVLCLIIALSDCIIVSSYSDGELLLTRIHNYVLFLSTFIYGSTSEFQILKSFEFSGKAHVQDTLYSILIS